MALSSLLRGSSGPPGLAMRGRLGGDRSRMDLSAPWRHIDIPLVVCSFALAALGLLMIFSATKATWGNSFLVRQTTFVAIGAAVMAVVALIDYRRLRDFAWLAYGGSVVLLLVVLSPLGTEVYGAQAWFSLGGPFQLQPAEVAKLSLILVLGSLIADWGGELDLARVGIVLGVAAVPMGLILLQPDLGSMLVLVAIVIGMLLVGGLKGRYLLLLTMAGLILVFGVFNSDVLKAHQKDRLTAFIDPTGDSDAIYNVEQSQTAIANGGVTGSGLFDGSQTQLGYVPEQQTDFIFTAVGEELGFVGAAGVLILYGVALWRIWRIAQLSRDLLGTLLCVGVLSMLVFHIFENVGMAMGIMPVTGIPLPLLSYGGSSTLATFAGIGLVLNVHMHRFR
jgi:rod shape determining protein RodA